MSGGIYEQKQILYECIEKFGILDERTLNKSEEIDKYIVKEYNNSGEKNYRP